MANWCQNIAYLTAPDEADAIGFIASASIEKLNEDFDVEDRHAPTLGGAGINYIKRQGNLVEIASQCRNEPPIELYRAMEAQGWKVAAIYWEPDNWFWGTFRDGMDDRQEYQLDEDKDHLIQLPPEVRDRFRPAVREFAPGWNILSLFN